MSFAQYWVSFLCDPSNEEMACRVYKRLTFLDEASFPPMSSPGQAAVPFWQSHPSVIVWLAYLCGSLLFTLDDDEAWQKGRSAVLVGHGPLSVSGATGTTVDVTGSVPALWQDCLLQQGTQQAELAVRVCAKIRRARNPRHRLETHMDVRRALRPAELVLHSCKSLERLCMPIPDPASRERSWMGFTRLLARLDGAVAALAVVTASLSCEASTRTARLLALQHPASLDHDKHYLGGVIVPTTLDMSEFVVHPGDWSTITNADALIDYCLGDGLVVMRDLYDRLLDRDIVYEASLMAGKQCLAISCRERLRSWQVLLDQKVAPWPFCRTSPKTTPPRPRAPDSDSEGDEEHLDSDGGGVG